MLGLHQLQSQGHKAAAIDPFASSSPTSDTLVQIPPNFKLSLHFDLNHTPVMFYDCILHSCDISWWQNDDININYHRSQTRSVVVLATIGVSRITFCQDDSHTDSQGENNGNKTIYTVCDLLVQDNMMCYKQGKEVRKYWEDRLTHCCIVVGFVDI